MGDLSKILTGSPYIPRSAKALSLAEAQQRQRHEQMTHFEPQGQRYALPEIADDVAAWARANPLEAALTAGSMLPVVGDISGIGADITHYYKNPEDITPTNLGISAAGAALPFVPGFAGIGAIKRTSTSAADNFGDGANRIKYLDEETGGTMVLLQRPGMARDVSVLDLNVPEQHRGTGVGKALLKNAMEEFPSMGGQIHSKAAAVNAFKAGRRPYGMPDATIDDVFAIMDDMSSVNMVTQE